MLVVVVPLLLVILVRYPRVKTCKRGVLVIEIDKNENFQLPKMSDKEIARWSGVWCINKRCILSIEPSIDRTRLRLISDKVLTGRPYNGMLETAQYKLYVDSDKLIITDGVTKKILRRRSSLQNTFYTDLVGTELK